MYYVYILTNYNNRVMYVGVTNDLVRRLYEHRNGTASIFTKKYHVHKLVYYEDLSWLKSQVKVGVYSVYQQSRAGYSIFESLSFFAIFQHKVLVRHLRFYFVAYILVRSRAYCV